MVSLAFRWASAMDRNAPSGSRCDAIRCSTQFFISSVSPINRHRSCCSGDRAGSFISSPLLVAGCLETPAYQRGGIPISVRVHDAHLTA